MLVPTSYPGLPIFSMFHEKQGYYSTRQPLLIQFVGGLHVCVCVCCDGCGFREWKLYSDLTVRILRNICTHKQLHTYVTVEDFMELMVN